MRTQQLRISNSQNSFWMEKCASRVEVNTRPQSHTLNGHKKKKVKAIGCLIRGVPKSLEGSRNYHISINSSTSWRVERRGTDAKLFPSISWSTSKEGKSSCWTRVRTSVEYWKCACSPGKVIIGAKFPFLGWKSAQQTELKSSRKVGQFCLDQLPSKRSTNGANKLRRSRDGQDRIIEDHFLCR